MSIYYINCLICLIVFIKYFELFLNFKLKIKNEKRFKEKFAYIKDVCTKNAKRSSP